MRSNRQNVALILSAVLLSACASSAASVRSDAASTPTVTPVPGSTPSPCVPGETLLVSAGSKSCRLVALTTADPVAARDPSTMRNCMVCNDTRVQCIGQDSGRDLLRVLEPSSQGTRKCAANELFFEHPGATEVYRSYTNGLVEEEQRRVDEALRVRDQIRQYEEKH